MKRWPVTSTEVILRTMEMAERLIVGRWGYLPASEAADKIIELTAYIIEKLDGDEGK